MNSNEICSKLELNPDFGFRWLRCLCVLGYLKHHGGRSFSVTDKAKKLRKDAQFPLWRLVQPEDDIFITYTVQNLIKTMKSGSGATYERVHKKTFWDRLEENEDDCGDNFDEIMKLTSGFVEKSIQFCFDKVKEHFEGHKLVCDIGGGNGALMKMILDYFRSNDKLIGTVMDLPRIFEKKKENLMSHEQMKYFAGNFFDAEMGIPKEQDAYILKRILHDWSDDKSVEILENIHSCAKVGSTLLIFEFIIADLIDEKNGSNVFMDLHMMQLVGGKERTVSEWKELVEKGGWKYQKVILAEDDKMRNGLIVAVKE